MIRIARREPQADLAGWPGTLHPVLAQVLCRRALAAPVELELTLRHLMPVGQFASLDTAVKLLLEFRTRNIVIVGDFDADGATSTALMVLALRRLGFEQVDYFIPDRFELGYGLTPGVVAALADLDDALIVTVDNGISSCDGVAAAKQRGFRVIVTDHHLPPETLPDADVIVNPNLPGSEFPGHNLAGVGVAFYLIAALGRALGHAALAAEFLDLVALGTVADLVRLDHGNRILVEQGLRRIRAGQCRPGIRALCKAAGTDHASVVASTLGFQLGPRLNAAGRLDDMSLGVQCLTAESAADADRMADELDRLNRQRREIEARMKQEASEIIDSLMAEQTTSAPPALSLFREDWHEGVVGLIASRIKDRVHRPTFAFAPTADNGLKGSGRSIPGFHLRDALADIDARYPGLIVRFGGHAMAAGLTLARDRLDEFKAALLAVSEERLNGADLDQQILSDGPLEAEHLSLPVATMLRDASPWGQGFPEPRFDGTFELIESRILKDVHLKMRLRSDASAPAIEAIAFNAADSDWPVGGRRRIAYRLDINDYFAEPRVQLIVEHIESPPED